MIKSLSQWAIGLYQQCPRMFELIRIWNLARPAGGGLVQGTAYHAALAATLLQKAHTGDPLTLPDTLNAYLSSFDREMERAGGGEFGTVSEIDWGEKDVGVWKDEGARLVEVYYNEHVPKLQPLYVEQPFEATVGDILLRGRIDLIDVEGKVYDHKLVAKSMTQKDADKDIQPAIYQLGLRRELDFVFHCAVNTKKPSIQEVIVHCGEDRMVRTESLIQDVWRLIQTGVFPCNTRWWGCPCGLEEACGKP